MRIVQQVLKSKNLWCGMRPAGLEQEQEKFLEFSAATYYYGPFINASLLFFATGRTKRCPEQTGL
jgi:hypothetical protein